MAIHLFDFLNGWHCGKLIAVLAQLTAQPLTLFFPCQNCFENRKVGDVGNDCLLSLDGTDVQIAKGYEKPFYSYKFKKSGFHYEVGLCIKTSDICWWARPYLPSIWNDEIIFQHGLAKLLEPAERIEADGASW
jgi:hypothetical protein